MREGEKGIGGSREAVLARLVLVFVPSLVMVRLARFVAGLGWGSRRIEAEGSMMARVIPFALFHGRRVYRNETGRESIGE
jgi:hypothetical protein